MRASSCFVCVLLAAVSCACVDTSPIVVREERDAAALPDASYTAACRACIVDEGAPCRSVYDACTAVPKCADLVECALAHACLAPSALEERITCSQPCLTELGIVNTDPALGPILLLNTCSQSACREACVIE